MTDPISQTNNLNNVITNCLNLDNPKSFFLFAGAGSGKTRALVEAMKMFRNKYGQEFRLTPCKFAVITYTKAARDEIKDRINYDSIFLVSTIHSFAWELIRPYYKEISGWLKRKLEMDINSLQEKQQKGRAGTKAVAERVIQIESKQKRLARLDTIKYFTYNPDGENIDKNSLNHAEVIGIAADFLNNKPLMQKIIIRKYPVLLIDESQDTQKDLIDAFFTVQSKHPKEFCLSLFGDTMQRIYPDGKSGLGEAIPADWEKPAITINYRCPKRIVELINMIRSAVDDHIQEPREDAPIGFVRLFLVQDNENIDKNATEAKIVRKMAEITSDALWSGDNQEIKTLTLEHHMAARRGKFNNFFEPLYQVQQFKTGLLDGTLTGIPFFSQQLLPLVKAMQNVDKFAVAQIIKRYSPLVSPDTLIISESPLAQIHKTNAAVKSLFSLWNNNSDPLLIEVLKAVSKNGLFPLPDIFKPIVSRDESIKYETEPNDTTETYDHNLNIDAWDKALSAPFSQFESYVKYISDTSPFGTHQGIKGLQFSRVMVILDDNEARGSTFSYDKLFGAKNLSPTDIKNEEEGKETSIDRIRRLFYVTCSRAQKSLAIVVYTNEMDKIKKHLQNLNWFSEKEIIEIS